MAAGYNYNIDNIVYETLKQKSGQVPPEPRGGADGVQPPSSSSLSPEEAAAQWEANQEYIAHCNATYGVPGLVEFAAGYGGLPKAVLQHPGGARAEVYLHGGTVTSWRHADGREMLHLRQANVFDGRQPIRCGGRLGAWVLLCVQIVRGGCGWLACALMGHTVQPAHASVCLRQRKKSPVSATHAHLPAPCSPFSFHLLPAPTSSPQRRHPACMAAVWLWAAAARRLSAKPALVSGGDSLAAA